MKKRLFLIGLLTFVFASLTFSGCSFFVQNPETEENKKESTEQEPVSNEPTPEEISYVFYCRSSKNQETVLLYPGMNPAAALEQLGEPLSYYEAPSCALDGMDQIYTYSGYELTVSMADTEVLTTIRLTDDSFTTAEGIYIGSTVTELMNVYGETGSEFGEYRYQKGEMELAFLTKNQAVTSVEYRYQP